MFPVEAFRDSVTAFSAIVSELDIAFHLTGGITSLAYGEPRMTQDIDIVIDPIASSDRVDALVERLLQSRFLLKSSTVRTAIQEERQFQLLDSIESLKLDVYPRELIAGELDRSQQFEVFDGVSFPIVSLADAVLSKLIWVDRGSHKSRRDVRQLLRQCSEPMTKLVTSKAKELGLHELLKQIVQEPQEFD